MGIVMLRKFFNLLLKKNGYVLEQLVSPLVVKTTPEHEELKAICNPRQRSDTSPSLPHDPAPSSPKRPGAAPLQDASRSPETLAGAPVPRAGECACPLALSNCHERKKICRVSSPSIMRITISDLRRRSGSCFQEITAARQAAPLPLSRVAHRAALNDLLVHIRKNEKMIFAAKNAWLAKLAIAH